MHLPLFLFLLRCVRALYTFHLCPRRDLPCLHTLVSFRQRCWGPHTGLNPRRSLEVDQFFSHLTLVVRSDPLDFNSRFKLWLTIRFPSL